MSAPLVSLLIILFAPLPLGFFHILISGFLFCDLFKHENLKKKKKPSRSYFALAVFALCLQEHRLKYCVHLYLQAVYHQECSANELGGLDCSSRFTSGVFRLCIHIWLLFYNIFDVQQQMEISQKLNLLQGMLSLSCTQADGCFFLNIVGMF